MKLKGKVFVGMSGGVDSSVTAALLREQGYDAVGVHLRCFNVDGCAEQDAEDARRAAEHLGIPFYTIDLEEEYRKNVVDYMVEGYRRGETPNPDVVCNEKIKFGAFFKNAMEMGADYVATGHYVRLRSRPNSPLLFGRGASGSDILELQIARDKNKDQSYFLWRLTQEQLRHCLFPVGDYRKPEVRSLAKKFGLHNAEKKDSQGICFLGRVTLMDFLKSYIPERRGEIFTTAGDKVGEHRGATYYTVGQRRGLDIKERAHQTTDSLPYYVVSKDVKKNVLVVAEGEKSPDLYKKEISLHELNFQGGTRPSKTIKVFARVRYRQPLSCAVLYGNRLVFDSAQKFVAAGQSAVFYDRRGVMLGGGVIGAGI